MPFQIFLRNDCNPAKCEAVITRKAEFSKTTLKDWDYATATELAAPPWSYSPDEVAIVVKDCTSKGRWIADAQFPNDESKRSYLVKGKTKFQTRRHARHG